MDNKFKQEPLQLVAIKEDGMIEITSEGINFLSLLQNEKISIISNTFSTISDENILNNFLTSCPHKFTKDSKGLWMWGSPLPLPNGQKMILINTQQLTKDDPEHISEKLFMLSAIMSNCIIYDCNGDENENFFLKISNIKDKIIFPKLKENSTFSEKDNLFSFLPWLVIINDNIEYDFNQNKSLANLYPKITVIKSNEASSLIQTIKAEVKYKSINNIEIDGDSLFGVMQNYIDSINNEEHLNINSALENVLLSKAKSIAEKNSDIFKNTFIKNLESKNQPLNIIEVYKSYMKEEENEITKFSAEIKDILTAEQNGSNIVALLKHMRRDIDTFIESTKEYNEEWLETEVKELEKIISIHNNVEDVKQIENVSEFVSSYNDEIQNFLMKLIEIPNIEVCKNLFEVLKRTITDYVLNVNSKLAEKIENIYENYKNETESQIRTLEDKMKRISEESERNKKLADESSQEKIEINKNNIELQTKFEKLLRESKNKEKEQENQINIEVQKTQKMEQFYSNIVKDKDTDISNLRKNLENIKKEYQEKNLELTNEIKNLTKINESLTKENENLKTIQEGKTKENNPKSENGENISNLFKKIQNTFIEFKQSLEKIKQENENVFKTKYLELSTKEIESKSHNWIEEIRIFREEQIKTLTENYEKNLQKAKNEIEDLTFQLTTTANALSEENNLKKLNIEAIDELQNQKKQIEDISHSKDILIQKQKEDIKLLNDRINDLKKIRDDLDMNLNKNILNYKMKEDELETMIMVIDGMLSKRKDKYDHNISRLGAEMKTAIEIITKEYKIFSH